MLNVFSGDEIVHVDIIHANMPPFEHETFSPLYYYSFLQQSNVASSFAGQRPKPFGYDIIMGPYGSTH